MKKILIFSLAYFPKVGGAEVAIREITNRISDIEFHLVTHRFDLGDLHEEKIGNVQVHRIGGGASYFAKALFVPRAVVAARKLHRKHHFDGAWAMMSYMVFPILFAKFLGVRLPYAITLQEGDSYGHVFLRPHILLVLPFLSLGFRGARAISAISEFLAGWAGKMGYRREVHVVPNGVDVQHFSEEYPASVINEVKDSLGKKMGDIFLITTSRLVHKNAIDVCLRALPQLPENVHLLVLGTGPDEMKLKKRAADLCVTARVRFIGHIGHDELPKYLKACDIFVRPSRTEGMGNSFIEAFAAGLPVIATQEGGIADFLFDEKRNPDQPVTGFAVDKNSPKQIAEAVKNIMSHPEKVRAVVATAKQVAVEKYSWETIARDMREKVFRPVLEG